MKISSKPVLIFFVLLFLLALLINARESHFQATKISYPCIGLQPRQITLNSQGIDFPEDINSHATIGALCQ